MKKLILLSFVLLIAVASVQAASLRQIQLEITDEFWQPVTNITQISVFNAGTSTATTIFSDRAGAISMTNPITTSSTNTTFDQSLGFVRWFQRAPDYKVTITDGTKTLTIDNRTGSVTRFPWFNNYIGTAASLSINDNQTLTVGTDSDATLSWVNASDILNWIPLSDGVDFNIGSTSVAKQFDFNVFVGGIGGGGLAIDEGASTFGWTGGVFNVNASSNFATNINTGTSTGAISLGSSAAGIWAIDGDESGTINADTSISMTVSAGTISIAPTGGDLTLDAVDKSLILRGTEEASDAVKIHADGTAGGVDIDSGTGDITATSTDDVVVLAADNITLDTTDGSMTFTAAGAANGDVTFTVADKFSVTSTDTAAAGATIIVNGGASETIHLNSKQGTGTDTIFLDADVGGIKLLADGAAAGDITLDAEDDIILTTTGKCTITNTEAVTISGALTISGATTFTGGQTRTVRIEDVFLDGTVPPSQTAVGTSGQSQIPVYSFDANPNATGDDYVFLLWTVPAGYVVDSADLFFNFSYSTAETDGDDVVFDITVLALTPGTGAAGGTAFDAAGSAVAALDVDLVNGDGDEGKIMQGTFDIEVTALAVGDDVLIAFWVDESECDLAASGTVDIHDWFITYESTE